MDLDRDPHAEGEEEGDAVEAEGEARHRVTLWRRQLNKAETGQSTSVEPAQATAATSRLR